MKINNPFETYSRGMTARERRIRSRWALMFVISSLIAVWSTVKYYNEADDLEKQIGINTVLQTQTVKMTNTIDSLRIECDSKDSLLTKKGIFDLESELFQTGAQLGRYHMALELLRYKDSKAANKFELMLSETE
jgi:hypothetical protein